MTRPQQRAAEGQAVVALLVALTVALFASGCGGSSGGGNGTLGSQVAFQFLSAVLRGLGAQPINGNYWQTYIGSQCQDQSTGIGLDRFTAADVANEGGPTLFHCSVDIRSNGGSNQLGELYYLTIRPNHSWYATWEPVALTQYDVKDPCQGIACSEALDMTLANVAGTPSKGYTTGTGVQVSTTGSDSMSDGSTGNTGSNAGNTGAGNSSARTQAKASNTVPAPSSFANDRPTCGTFSYEPGGTVRFVKVVGQPCGSAETWVDGWADHATEGYTCTSVAKDGGRLVTCGTSSLGVVFEVLHSPSHPEGSANVLSPSGNILCSFGTFGGVNLVCQTQTPPQQASLTGAGRLSVCTGQGCLGDPPAGAIRTLAYGSQVTIGPLTCKSLTTGMRCTDASHGFIISRSGVAPVNEVPNDVSRRSLSG